MCDAGRQPSRSPSMVQSLNSPGLTMEKSERGASRHGRSRGGVKSPNSLEVLLPEIVENLPQSGADVDHVGAALDFAPDG